MLASRLTTTNIFDVITMISLNKSSKKIQYRYHSVGRFLLKIVRKYRRTWIDTKYSFKRVNLFDARVSINKDIRSFFREQFIHSWKAVRYGGVSGIGV